MDPRKPARFRGPNYTDLTRDRQAEGGAPRFRSRHAATIGVYRLTTVLSMPGMLPLWSYENALSLGVDDEAGGHPSRLMRSRPVPKGEPAVGSRW